MKEPKKNRRSLVIARKVTLKFLLVIALLSATAVAYASQTGYFWGYLPNGDTAWLWCGSGGNYWTRCDTGSCAPGESCPCYRCETSECQDTANYYCDLYAY
jgi:hypothetical protein